MRVWSKVSFLNCSEIVYKNGPPSLLSSVSIIYFYIIAVKKVNEFDKSSSDSGSTFFLLTDFAMAKISLSIEKAASTPSAAVSVSKVRTLAQIRSAQR